MILELSTLLTIVPFLLLLEAFFAGAEIALLSADKLTLKQQAKDGLWGAGQALDLAGHPERVLSVTLLMTNLCMIGVSSLFVLFFMGRGGNAEVWTVLTTSPLVVLFGEITPKTIFQRNAQKLARWVAPVVAGAFWAGYPLTRFLSGYTHRLSRMIGPIEEMLTGKKKSTREELRSLLSYGRRESELKSTEKKMIKRIFDFKDTEAKHALIPLVRVEAIDESATVKQALERFETHRHSRMPVFSGRVDNIVGVIEASDLISALDLNQSIRHYMSSAHFVAETQSLEDLLREMKTEDVELVVVVDEHGGAVGILTFEDIVEEIVGEISDEYDTDSAPYKTLSEQSWLVQARMEVQQINDILKLEIPQGEYETLSGFLLQQFGRIPGARDELYFNTPAGLLKFMIRSATPKHIESVVIERIQSQAP